MADFPTRDDGKAARDTLSLADQGILALGKDRDPVGIIEGQNTSRLQDLVPVRIGRMLESPFAFYRGTAAIMASDLKDAPVCGFDVVACGDAHISNFGFYGSPERDLVFDVNDFDESAIAPWEWDVKRMATSVHIAGRSINLTEDQCRQATQSAADAYRTVLDKTMQMGATDRYFARVDDSELAQELGKSARKKLEKLTDKARTRTSAQVLKKLTTQSDDGQIRIDDQPPLLRHIDDPNAEKIDALYKSYRTTASNDIGYLLLQYEVVDYALRVVGVGSVGTRCYLIALAGLDGEILFLQAKEATDSVLVSHGGRPPKLPGAAADLVTSQGQRVVSAQRILQASSDPFLGWVEDPAGIAGKNGPSKVDYYWRQFRDMKGSIDPSSLDADGLEKYGQLCAGMLARAHAQSPTGHGILGYLGSNDEFAQAVANWSAAYADVAQADYDALQKAVSDGKLPAATDV